MGKAHPDQSLFTEILPLHYLSLVLYCFFLLCFWPSSITLSILHYLETAVWLLVFIGISDKTDCQYIAQMNYAAILTEIKRTKNAPKILLGNLFLRVFKTVVAECMLFDILHTLNFFHE